MCLSAVLNALPTGEQGRTGGVLTILPLTPHSLHGVPQATIDVVGVLDAESVAKYAGNSLEKALRLRDNPQHMFSRESRDEAKGFWAGAIRIGDYIFSFSGLPEEADECLILVLAVVLGLLNPIQAAGLATHLENTLYGKLMEQSQDLQEPALS